MITQTAANFPTSINGFSLITTREREILNLISIGNSSTQIAKALYISIETVKSHRKNMRRKLEVCNSASMVRKAYDVGILKVRRL